MVDGLWDVSLQRLPELASIQGGPRVLQPPDDVSIALARANRHRALIESDEGEKRVAGRPGLEMFAGCESSERMWTVPPGCTDVSLRQRSPRWVAVGVGRRHVDRVRRHGRAIHY